MTNKPASHTPYQASPVAARRSTSLVAKGAFGIAMTCAFAAVMSGLGTRWGLWDFRTGFTILRWAAYGGIATVVIAAVAVVLSRQPGAARSGYALAIGALLLGAITVAIPWQSRRSAAGAPPIHDITTDTEDPPTFVAVAPLRANDPNPIEYGGAEIAQQQIAAYPEIRPVILDLPQDRAFQRALDVATSRGWEIVAADAAAGRIEATDRTFWFGFRDDVVIRLTPVDGRTLVDVRSKSRVGRGDRGMNATRVREYLRDLPG